MVPGVTLLMCTVLSAKSTCALHITFIQNNHSRIVLEGAMAFYLKGRWSTTALRLSGRNAVQVLATLLLLSYTKLLRLLITVSSTTITYPNGYNIRAVWFYDGNVDFLQGKYLLLFIVTLLLFIFLSVPYTLTLVSYQWLLKISHARGLQLST